jgi:hypothetical protein
MKFGYHSHCADDLDDVIETLSTHLDEVFVHSTFAGFSRDTGQAGTRSCPVQALSGPPDKRPVPAATIAPSRLT